MGSAFTWSTATLLQAIRLVSTYSKCFNLLKLLNSLLAGIFTFLLAEKCSMPSWFVFGKNIFNVTVPKALIVPVIHSHIWKQKTKPNESGFFYFIFKKCFQLLGKYLLYSENQLTCKDFCGIRLRVLHSKGVTP